MEGFAECPLPPVLRVQVAFLGGLRPALLRDLHSIAAVRRTWMRPSSNIGLGLTLFSQPDYLKDTNVTTACGQTVWIHGSVLASYCDPERVNTLLQLPAKRFPQGRYWVALFYFLKILLIELLVNYRNTCMYSEIFLKQTNYRKGLLSFIFKKFSYRIIV